MTEFSGHYVIPAKAESVWAALNDPNILRNCIPGCEQLESMDQAHFSAVVALKVGPVKATFRANIEITESEPPFRCVLNGEGQGGVAGFARGSAAVSLTSVGDATTLDYRAQAVIGGKLAQLGQRLIEGAAKQVADDFFGRFAAILATPGLDETVGSCPQPVPKNSDGLSNLVGKFPPIIWACCAILVAAVCLIAYRMLLVH